MAQRQQVRSCCRNLARTLMSGRQANENLANSDVLRMRHSKARHTGNRKTSILQRTTVLQSTILQNTPGYSVDYKLKPRAGNALMNHLYTH